MLVPIFVPNRLAGIDAGFLGMSSALIDRVASAGRCEFMAEYAQRFPIAVFLGLMGR